MRTLLVMTVLALAGSLARAAEPASLDMTAGKKVYVGKCARCHKFYDPMAYDADQWSTWMTKMKRKARLNDTQFQQVSAYLESVRSR